MFTGSMVGAGAPVFAVMSYVISHQKMDKTSGFEVELNTKLLQTMIGEPEEVIQKAVDYLCAPDPKTTTEGEEGRRLVRIGAFSYRVVNGLHYHNIKTAEDLREKNRERQAKYRAAHPDKSKRKNPNRGAAEAFEKVAVAAHGAGDQKAFDLAVTSSLPEGCQ